MIDNFEVVPEELKETLMAHYATGFTEWQFSDYSRFIKSFKSRELGDIEAISADMGTKTVAEVSQYMDVFLRRFRELKEREVVVMKFERKSFEV